jgi:hypothetical protein
MNRELFWNKGILRLSQDDSLLPILKESCAMYFVGQRLVGEKTVMSEMRHHSLGVLNTIMHDLLIIMKPSLYIERDSDLSPE